MSKEKEIGIEFKRSLDIVNKCDFIISISRCKGVENTKLKIFKTSICSSNSKQR